jgi:CRP/FNR family cyclic AMP-dependent transcriptional regulator
MAFTAQAVLRRNQLFRHLDDAALEKVAALATRRAANKGALIFAQGDEGEALFGIAAGQVRISATDSTGQERHIRDFGPGHAFGEIAILDGGPRTASALAVADTELLVISRARFIDLLERDPSLAIHLLKVLCERLRWTSELVEDSAFLDLPGQLAKKLLQLAEQNGIRGADDIEVIISQSELGDFLGVTRQIVNTHLQTWRANGWVRLGRGRIFIVDAEQLRSLTE